MTQNQVASKGLDTGAPRRIAGIDTFRVIAVFCVILIHVGFMSEYQHSGLGYNFIYHFVRNFSGFAVPFFFAASGYFFGKSLEKGAALGGLVSRYSRRFLRLFFIWSVIYLFVPYVGAHSVLEGGLGFITQTLRGRMEWVLSNPLTVLLAGTANHLWFLMALVSAFWVIALFIYLKKEKYLLPFSIGLYLIGLCGASYGPTPLGIQMPFDSRNGPFLSTFFVVTGFRRASCANPPKTFNALALILTGIMIVSTEVYVLNRFYNSSYRIDYLIGFMPLSAGIFLFTLSNPGFGKSVRMPSLAPLVLGIYLIHILVLTEIDRLRFLFHPMAWEVLLPFFVFMLSAGAVFMLQKSPFMRRLLD